MAPHTGAMDSSAEARGKVVTRMGTQQYNNHDRYVMNLCHLNHGLYCVQSGVLPKYLDTNYFFLYLLSLIMCERVGKQLLKCSALCIRVSSDLLTFLITMLIF